MTEPIEDLRARWTGLADEVEPLIEKRDAGKATPGQITRLENLDRGLMAAGVDLAEAESRERRLERVRHFAENPANHESGDGPAGDLDRDPFRDPADSFTRVSNPWSGADLDRATDTDIIARSLSAVAETPGMSDIGREAATARLEGTTERGVHAFTVAASDPAYLSFFTQRMNGEEHLASPEERSAARRVADVSRAYSIGTGANGGDFVPVAIDPSLTINDAGWTSPIRRLATTALTTSTTHRFVTSAAVTASYDSEASEVSDDQAALAERDVILNTVRAFVPYSIETELYASNLTSQLAGLLVEAIADIEAQEFAVGTAGGASSPEGVVSGLVAASSITTSAGTDTFALGDIYSVFENLGARYRRQASWLMPATIINETRQFGTADGALWHRLADDSGIGDPLLGRPLYECSDVDGTYGSGENYVAVVADFKKCYGIADRVGVQLEMIPHLFATANNRPSGQRGLFAYAAHGARVIATNAGQVLNIT